MFRSVQRNMSKANGTLEYIEFIRGRKTPHGITHEKILNYTDQELEGDHEYIQWIFPLATSSMFNPDAPVINVKELQNYPEASAAILRSSEKLTKFWGIHSDPVDDRRLRLLNGHNGLRFSRFLQSMVYHGHANIADEVLQRVLSNVHKLSPSRGKGGKTLWEEKFLEAKEKMNELEENREESK
jgi:hypothetical protein